MSNAVDINDHLSEAQKEVVSMLQELLQDAKKGNIDDLVFLRSGNQTHQMGWAGGGNNPYEIHYHLMEIAEWYEFAFLKGE